MSLEIRNLKYQVCSLAGLLSKISRTDGKSLAWPLAQQQYGLNDRCRCHLASSKLLSTSFKENPFLLKNHCIEAQRKKSDFFQIVKHFKGLDPTIETRFHKIPDCSKCLPIEGCRAPKMILPLQTIISRHFNQIYKMPVRRPENRQTVSSVINYRSRAKPTEGEKKSKQDDHKHNRIHFEPADQAIPDPKKTQEPGKNVVNKLQLVNKPKKGRLKLERIYAKFKHNKKSNKSRVNRIVKPLRSTVQEKVRRPKGDRNRRIAKRRKTLQATKQETAVRRRKSEKPNANRSKKRTQEEEVVSEILKSEKKPKATFTSNVSYLNKSLTSLSSHYDDKESEGLQIPRPNPLLESNLKLKDTENNSLPDFDPDQLLFYPYEHIYFQQEKPEKVPKPGRKRKPKVNRKVAHGTEIPISTEKICKCGICLRLQRYRSEANDPLIAKMKREAKRLELKAYLREQNCRTCTADDGIPDNSRHNIVQDDIEPCCQIVRSKFNTYVGQQRHSARIITCV